jgi:hypothetical protein
MSPAEANPKRTRWKHDGSAGLMGLALGVRCTNTVTIAAASNATAAAPTSAGWLGGLQRRTRRRAHPPAGSEDSLDITIPHKICHSHTETLGNPMEGAES